MLEIKNTEVHGIDRSVKAINRSFNPEFFDTIGEISDIEWKVANKLGSNIEPMQSHDAFLKGIVVWFDMKAPNYFLDEFKRYRDFNIIMSSSTMHSIKKIVELDCFNAYISEASKDKIKILLHRYEKDKSYENFIKLRSNIPSGMELCLTIVTNYLQLKRISIQRSKHKLKDWTEIFIPWIYSLPCFNKLTTLGGERMSNVYDAIERAKSNGYNSVNFSDLSEDELKELKSRGYNYNASTGEITWVSESNYVSF